MRLANKKALITGASRGIGRAIAELFLSEGAGVWGLSTKKPDGVDERFHWITADLGDTAAVESIIENAIKESGGFDIVVNNAGVTKDGLSFRMSVDDFRRVLDINLTAAFIVSRCAAKDMIKKRPGLDPTPPTRSIINMSSVVGIHGNGGQANYAASKAGLIGMTKSLARECGGRGVRVNAIAPGFIESDMTAVLPDAAKEKMLETIPLKRIGKPADIAAAALFLASDESSYITGQVITVDGGMFI